MDPTGLVGRQAERERLERAVSEAAEGSGSLVLLAGEAGARKTRLAQSVAGSSGHPALIGRASHGTTAPYGPLTEALPALGPAEGDRAALVETLRRVLAAAASDEPLVVVLEDLHWSDDATLELLPELADAVADLPVLVIGSYRSDGLPRHHLLRRVRHELRRAGRLKEVGLGPLDKNETAELIEAVLGEPPGPEVVNTIYDRTQGLPFFVEELARAMEVRETFGPLTRARRCSRLSPPKAAAGRRSRRWRTRSARRLWPRTTPRPRPSR